MRTTTASHENYPDTHHDNYSKTVFGFWLYLMSDFILFGALFATYVVLSDSTFGGHSGKEIFFPLYTLIQTLLLLTATFTAGLAGASAHRLDKKRTLVFFAMTFVLGAAFFGMQIAEFARFIHMGDGWDKSAFLSAYFTVVGTHAAHILFGLLWTVVLLVPVCREGLSMPSVRRLTCLRMFWQFVNIVWVFIFSFVYLMGVI